MKTSELKIGDKIKFQTRTDGIQEGVIVTRTTKIPGFVVNGWKSGYKTFQYHVCLSQIISKIESKEIPVEQERVFTFTEGELHQLCESVYRLTRKGLVYCVDFGYENVVKKAAL